MWIESIYPYAKWHKTRTGLLKSSIFWDIMPCSPLEVNRRFWGRYRLYLQGWRIFQAWNQHEAGVSCWFLAWFILQLCFLPAFSCLSYSSTMKMEVECSSETSVISQKMRLFMISDVRTSNPISRPTAYTLRIVGGGVQTGSTRHRGHLLSYCACPGWLWGWRIIRWNEDWQGKPKCSEKTCPNATFFTTNPTWPDTDSNPDRCGGNPATNRFSYGAASTAYTYYALSHVCALTYPSIH
jgi:hypothetical protein